MILDCDDNRCVLTGEVVKQALEAAHLIPAKEGENDMPFNGVALRADLHRLFDAGLFTFDGRGTVVNLAPGLSSRYRRLLQGKKLPSATIARVKATLSLPTFLSRMTN